MHVVNFGVSFCVRPCY